jgi:hypothetical protein
MTHITTDTISTAWEEIPVAVAYWGTADRVDSATVVVTPYDDPENAQAIVLGMLDVAIRRVLDMYPETAAAQYIRRQDIDAEAADVIAQVAAFGEIVYG